MTIYVNGVAQGQDGGSITEFAGEVTISDMSQSGNVAHGLGLTPAAAKVSVKPKYGTDVGGDSITITTDGTNITVNAVSGPFGGDWIFEVHYKSG